MVISMVIISKVNFYEIDRLSFTLYTSGFVRTLCLCFPFPTEFHFIQKLTLYSLSSRQEQRNVSDSNELLILIPYAFKIN